MDFNENVWHACRQVPKGKVTTYAEIAHALGTRAYRAVGTALKKNPNVPQTPCHRVVNSNGSIGGYLGKTNCSRKKELLEAEGIEIENGKIKDFSKKLHSFL